MRLGRKTQRGRGGEGRGRSASAPGLQRAGASLTWTAFFTAAGSKLGRLQLGKERSRAGHPRIKAASLASHQADYKQGKA